MKVKIEVTEEDIKNGERWMADKCPVALALNRKINDFNYVLYDLFETHDSRVYDVPESVGKFILKFDKTRKGKPFKFIIDVPKKYLLND